MQLSSGSGARHSATSIAVWTFLVLIGASALLVDLDAKSFWSDEVSQVDGLALGLMPVLRGWADPTHPPLSHLLMYLAGGLVGTTDFALRFIGVAPAIIALPLTAQLARGVVGPRAAVVVLALAASSPFLLLFDRMARYHALALLLFVLATLFFLRLWRRWRWADWAGYVAASAFLLYTDYLPGLGLLAHGLVALSRWRDRQWLSRWLLAPVAIAIAYAPGLLVLRDQLQPNLSVGVVPDDPAVSVGIAGFLFRAGYPLYAFLFGETVLPWNWPIVVPATLVAGALIVRAALRLSRSAEGRVLLVIFLVPLLGAALLMSTVLTSQTVGGAAKRLTFLGPIFYIILVAGLAGLERRLWMVGLVVLVAANLYGSTNYFRGEQFINQGYVVPWREIAEEIAAKAEPGDVVISGEGTLRRYLLDDERLPWLAIRAGEADEVAGIVRTVDEQKPPGIWIVWRDRGWRPIVEATDEVERHLMGQYWLDDTQGYLYTDPTDRFYRERILRRPAATYYVRVSHYRLAAGCHCG